MSRGTITYSPIVVLVRSTQHMGGRLLLLPAVDLSQGDALGLNALVVAAPVLGFGSCKVQEGVAPSTHVCPGGGGDGGGECTPRGLETSL